MNRNGIDEESEDGAAVPGGVSSTDMEVCLACQRRREGGKPYKHGHAPFCAKSIYYGKTDQEVASLKEERSNKLKDTKENIIRRMGLSLKDHDLKFPEISQNYEKVCDVPADLSAEHLSELVNANMGNPSRSPRAVTVILRYLQLLAPNLKRGTNDLISHPENMNKYEFFRKVFPRGCITFTIPKQDPTSPPNPEYRLAEGAKLHLVRWELHMESDLQCPLCQQGVLIHRKLAFSKAAVKPIIDIDGKLGWAIAALYRCNKCDTTLQGNDPELLRSLPLWMQQAYPVDHSWINKVKGYQIGRGFARMIETAFVGDTYDGHFISYFLRKLYDNRYRTEYNLLMETYQAQGETGDKRDEFPFERWTGDFTFPLGDFMREAYDFSRGITGEQMETVSNMPMISSTQSPPDRRDEYTNKRESPQKSASPGSPTKRQARSDDFDSSPHPPPSFPLSVGGGGGGTPHALAPAPPPLVQPRYIPPPGVSPQSHHASPYPPQWTSYGSAPSFPVHYSPPPARYPQVPPSGHGYSYPPLLGPNQSYGGGRKSAPMLTVPLAPHPRPQGPTMGIPGVTRRPTSLVAKTHK